VVASGNGVSLAGVEIARKLGVSPTTVSPILRVLVFQEALLDQVIMDWDVPVPVGLRRVAPDPEDVDAALEVDVLGTGHGDLVAEPACTRGSPTENARTPASSLCTEYDEMTPSPERANYATGGNEFFGRVIPCQPAFTG
jgi:hypothetical protein